MPEPSPETGARAADLARQLVDAVGPRPAGSPAEAQARAWVAATMQAAGYSVQEFPFRFPGAPRWLPLLLDASLIGLPLSLRMPVWVTTAFVLASVLAVGLYLLFYRSEMAPVREKLGQNRLVSANLLAVPNRLPVSSLDLLLVAHLDTARATPVLPPVLYRLFHQRIGWFLRSTAVLLVVTLVERLGTALPDGWVGLAVALYVLAAALLIGYDLVVFIGARGQYTAGANDNGSGIGLLLALAEQHTGWPRVGFLFTGAEETGLHGAQAAARWLKAQGAQPWVVSIDTIGAGEKIRVLEKQTFWGTTPAAKSVNSALLAALPDAYAHRMRRRDGDFSAFLQAGFPAGGLEGDGANGYWQAYHTLADGIQWLDARMLQRVRDGIERLLQTLPAPERASGEQHAGPEDAPTYPNRPST